MKPIHFIFLIGFFTSCASLPKAPSEIVVINFEKIKTLEPGKSSQRDVEKIFGLPDLKSSSGNGSEVMWAYQKGRLLLSFGATNLILKSFDWSVYSSDAEKDLVIAKSHFPQSRFVKSEEVWTNPHAAPSTMSYIDLETGVTIVTRISSDQVSSIFREAPGSSREPAVTNVIKYEL